MDSENIENPFRKNVEDEHVYTFQPNIEAYLPIRQKAYPLDKNIKETVFFISAGNEVLERSLSKNVQTIIRIQNNQTKILSYICKVLFEGIIEPDKKISRAIINLLERFKETKREIEDLRKQLEESNRLEEQLVEVNSKLTQILEKI